MTTIISKKTFDSAFTLAQKAATGLNLWFDVAPNGANTIELRRQDQEYWDRPRFEIIFPQEDDYEA